MSYLSCVKSFDGISLFSRASKSSKSLPISLIGTLNNIFTYGDNYGVKLFSADSENFKILWKMYHSNITLILVEELLPIDEQFYFDKMDILFDTLVLMYGLDDLINITNTEKFKKEIKVSFDVLDAVLDNSTKFDLFGGFLTNCIDTLIQNDSNTFQQILDSTCVSINTSYACLMMNGRVIVGSNAWWELKPQEVYLIALLCLTLSDSTSRDIPIYLPNKNPHQALRLLNYKLCSENIYLCFICSERPAVDSVEPTVKKIWHPFYKNLIALKQLLPRYLPSSISIDNNMIAFLLINKQTKCCMSSLCANEKVAFNIRNDEIKIRFDLLKYCYLNISSNFFHKNNKNSLKIANDIEDNIQITNCTEAYLLIKEKKCFALNHQIYEFYALFNQTIPTYALRGVTKTCFDLLINV